MKYRKPFFEGFAAHLRRGYMEKDKVPIDVYKKLICDMIQDMTDERFIRQIYSIVYRQRKRTGV